MSIALTDLPAETSDTSTEMDAAPEISVVIPLYNEEESIPHLHQALSAALEASARPYEIIIVDDGSKDRSFQLLSDLARQDPHLTVIRLRRNFGQTPAFSAGFDRAPRQGRDHDGRRSPE